ncbi:hypothetical protein ACIRPQ_14155 [Streptomyces sp. NPDC101213]|uniref:hypothetical protein n=1 Tax=Streptomyces sp. NPDC101213 TaxID=3366130 RepID=UPI00382C54D4
MTTGRERTGREIGTCLMADSEALDVVEPGGGRLGDQRDAPGPETSGAPGQAPSGP